MLEPMDVLARTPSPPGVNGPHAAPFKESRMQKQLVVTVIGADKPGIVESLADTITRQQGNWLASSMSELAGNLPAFCTSPCLTSITATCARPW